jgi:caa(3)-type oxidase subunit IV
MTEAHDQAGHHGPDVKAYLTIFAVLSVCTALSFVANWAMGQNAKSASIIMVIAVIKACCVAAIFMHLKWDWSRLYFLICPLFILATMMMIVLLPDLVFAWR